MSPLPPGVYPLAVNKHYNELFEIIKSSELLDDLTFYKLLIKISIPRSHLHYKLIITTQETEEKIGEFQGLINQPTEWTVFRENRNSPYYPTSCGIFR